MNVAITTKVASCRDTIHFHPPTATHVDGRGYVEVDCETGTMVYEGGLDKRSSPGWILMLYYMSYI